jgi:hypothetical protein
MTLMQDRPMLVVVPENPVTEDLLVLVPVIPEPELTPEDVLAQIEDMMNRGLWIQNAYHLDSYLGQPDRYCLVGMIDHICHGDRARRKCDRTCTEVKSVLEERITESCIEDFNDSHRFRTVRKMVRKTREELAKK